MSETKTRRQKLKSWVHHHRYDLATAGIIAGGIGAYAGIVFWAVKETNQELENHNRWANEMNDWLNDERQAGHNVYRLDDGRYLTVERDAVQATVIK